MDEPRLYRLFDAYDCEYVGDETYTEEEAMAHLRAQVGTEAEAAYYEGQIYFMDIDEDRRDLCFRDVVPPY